MEVEKVEDSQEEVEDVKEKKYIPPAEKVEIPQQERKLLQSYVSLTDECYKNPACKPTIQKLIQQYGVKKNIKLFRGQHIDTNIKESERPDPKKILTGDNYPWFSTSLNKKGAHTFLDWQSYDPKPCCLFTIHVRGVPILDINHVKDLKLSYPGESEILVLGGGTFYQDEECTIPGFRTIGANKKQGDSQFECWYTLPSKGGRRTRRKKLRKTRRKHKQ